MNKAYKPVLVIGLAVIALVSVALYVNVSSKEVVPWREDFVAAQTEAAKDRKPRLLYFTAIWCGPCDYMKHSTFASSSVKAALANYVPVKIDIDHHQDLVKQYGVGPIPYFVVIDADGHIFREVAGAMTDEEFINWLNGKSE